MNLDEIIPEEDVPWSRCLVCGMDLKGSVNRQLCGKTYCMNEKLDCEQDDSFYEEVPRLEPTDPKTPKDHRTRYSCIAKRLMKKRSKRKRHDIGMLLSANVAAVRRKLFSV